MGEFDVFCGLFNTVKESNEALSTNLATQNASFKAVTGKLNGIIEDEKRDGVPSLASGIIGYIDYHRVYTIWYIDDPSGIIGCSPSGILTIIGCLSSGILTTIGYIDDHRVSSGTLIAIG